MADKKSYSFMKDIKQAFSLDNAVLKYMQNNTPYKALQDLASKVKGTKPKTTPSIVKSAIRASRQPGMLVDAGGFDRRKTARSNAMFRGLDMSKSDRRGKPDGEVIYKKRKPVANKPTAKKYNLGVSKGGVSFKEAFAHYKKQGNKTFTWNGKKYTTDTASKKSTPTSNSNTVTLKSGKQGTLAQRLKELDKEKAAQATMSAAKKALARKNKG